MSGDFDPREHDVGARNVTVNVGIARKDDIAGLAVASGKDLEGVGGDARVSAPPAGISCTQRERGPARERR